MASSKTVELSEKDVETPSKSDSDLLQCRMTSHNGDVSPRLRSKKDDSSSNSCNGNSNSNPLPQRMTLQALEEWLIEQSRLKQRTERQRGPVVNSEDRQALLMLHDGVKRLGNGHFQAPVLWRNEQRPQNNLGQAIEAWKTLERRLNNKKDARRAYEEVIKKWIASEYVRVIPWREPEVQEEAFYLLHFPVYRFGQGTSKLRVVMNGASEFRGKSLNHFILKGPKVINSLVNVLLRFRRFAVAVSGDVQEMFLQVHLAEEDRKYHRFVFRFLDSDLLSIIEALVHLFGNRGSPTIVVFVIKWLATRKKLLLPLASETVLESSLVDDCMDSVPSVEQAVELKKRARGPLCRVWHEDTQVGVFCPRSHPRCSAYTSG